AVTYLLFGLGIAIVAGFVIGKSHLEGWLQPWVCDIHSGATAPVAVAGERRGWTDRYKLGLEAVREIFARVWMWIIPGIGTGALIHGYVPQDLMERIMGADAWWSVPVAVVMGIPMYTNAAGVIPIVEALLGNDVVRGSSGHDFLVDFEGANTLNGGFGDDELWALDHEGANAADLLQGWAGDDDLLGDDGDTMEGGDGVDSFYSVWQPGDAAVTITDFDPATESLFINTSDLPASPLLQLVDLGDGSGCEVQLNGETLAVLQGVSAAEVQYGNGGQNELWLLDRVGGQYYQPVLANMALAS
ncbi:MAG: permease, partial [Phaeovulum sp.]|uniref:permease n=2 Tax=Phaeovulum sp. TaxID=2934796 RepID=UPI002734D6DB